MSAGHAVLAPGRSHLDLTNAESVDDFFRKNHVDYVIHCALQGRNNLSGIDDALCMSNVRMFHNLWRNRSRFKRLINMGTGNEFDTTTNIDRAPETTLFERMPAASYGLAKNLIARTIYETPYFYNLRLFGVFHYSEQPKRFFRRLMEEPGEFHIYQDHEFDFVNLEDVVPMIDCVLGSDVIHSDINICYPKKLRLSEYARYFCDIHGLDADRVVVDGESQHNFTGDSQRFMSYQFDLKGLEAGLRAYPKTK
jgi:nucleoside-diphosphate-sugar epimerase